MTSSSLFSEVLNFLALSELSQLQCTQHKMLQIIETHKALIVSLILIVNTVDNKILCI